MTFQEQKENLKREIEISELVLEANSILKNYNWIFFHPYTQVFKIRGIVDRYKRGELSKKFVSDFFVKEFYNLDATINYVDGMFSHSDFIKPFTYFIEHSLILFFQRDYGGAINLMIPSIEGVFAKYLTEEKGIDLSGDRYKKLRNIVNYLKVDMIEKGERHFETNNKTFNRQQADYYKALERKYIENWFLNIHSFFSESLFADSRILSGNSLLNRHTIFHSFSLNVYHTQENYIKLFNSLVFLTWIFFQLENKSSFEIEMSKNYITKRIQYEHIIKKANSLLVNKHAILKDYPLHNRLDWAKQFDFVPLKDYLPLKLRIFLRLKTALDNIQTKWFINSIK